MNNNAQFGSDRAIGFFMTFLISIRSLSLECPYFRAKQEGVGDTGAYEVIYFSWRLTALEFNMSLAVEVAGFGLCQTASPYSILVICVQQETFQAWTVYRRYSSFVSLAEQLQILHPLIPNVPKYNPDNLSMDNLDHCRSAMDNW